MADINKNSTNINSFIVVVSDIMTAIAAIININANIRKNTHINILYVKYIFLRFLILCYKFR